MWLNVCVSRPELVGRARGHVDVEPARADRARRAHQPAHRRDEPAREQQRGDDREHDEQADDADRADQLLAELLALQVERHADADVADRRRRAVAGRAGVGAGVAGRRAARARTPSGCRPARPARCSAARPATTSVAAIRPGATSNCAAASARQRALREPGREAALRQHLLLRVEHGDVGDVGVGAEAVEDLLEVRAVGRVEAVLGELGEDREQRLALRPQLAAPRRATAA